MSTQASTSIRRTGTPQSSAPAGSGSATVAGMRPTSRAATRSRRRKRANAPSDGDAAEGVQSPAEASDGGGWRWAQREERALVLDGLSERNSDSEASLGASPARRLGVEHRGPQLEYARAIDAPEGPVIATALSDTPRFATSRP